MVCMGNDLCTETGLRVDEEIIYCQHTAVDEDGCVDDEAHETIWFHGVEQPCKWDD